MKNKNEFLYLVLSLAFIISNLFWGQFAYVTFLIMLVFVFINDIENNLALVFFLLPCIRILDVSGISNLINIVILCVGFRYILFEKKGKIDNQSLVFGVVLLIYEAIHLFGYVNTTFLYSEIFTWLNITFDIILMSMILHENKFYDFKNFGIYVNSLMYGVLASALVFFVVQGFSMIRVIMVKAVRLSAFGHDPNYFCIYILLAILGKQMVGSMKWIDVVEIILLAFLVILTSSKMGLICLVIYGVYLVVNAMFYSKYRKSIFRFGFILMIGIYFMRSQLSTLLDKVLSRFSYGNEHATLNTISSGRFDIVKDYLTAILNDAGHLFFGYGLEYNRIFGTLVAHNTFLDLFLSWGIVGSIFVMCSIIHFIFKENGKYSIEAYGVVFMFGFMLCALSCFTSDMFWFLLVYVVFALRYGDRKERNMYGR